MSWTNDIDVQIEDKEDIDNVIKERKKDIGGIKYNVTLAFHIDQEHLQKLAASKIGKNMVDLEIEAEYEDDGPVIDFSEVKFPQLKSIHLQSQALKAAHFTKEYTPLLESLNIEQLPGELSYFHLDLPKLQELNFQFVNIGDPTGFGKSLSQSPMLEIVDAYKLWGLGVPKSKTHILVLPNCYSLKFYRSDDLMYLKLWTPNLKELNLQACYSIEEVTLLDRRPNGYNTPEYQFTGTPSKYKVNFLNTSKPKGNILTHERCRGFFPNIQSDDIEDHMSFDPEDWDNV